MADAPPSLAIKEANVHLQALHERNIQLEKEVKQLQSLVPVTKEQEERLKGQSQIINEKDSKIQQLESIIQELKAEKDNAIGELQEKVNLLSLDVSKKNLVISQHTRKVDILTNVLKHKAALDNIVKSLNLVEENFIVDVDNMAQVTSEGVGETIESVDVQKLRDLDLETSL